MISSNIKAEFKAIVGTDRLLDAKEDILSYSYDSYVVRALPAMILFPRTTSEISGIIKIAGREMIPVTARGAGTGLSGGAVPAREGVVLCLSQMNQILEVNTPNRYAVVQPGVVNGHLQIALGREGYFYPPDPASFAVSTLGGNIAENAGGPRCLKYGVTADYILGLEVVLASGNIIRCGSKNTKDVTGYRLSSLFCGSEGTLGIVTEAILRVTPLPEARRTILAVYDHIEKTADTVVDVIGSGILPAAMELMDRTVINAVEDSAALGLPRQAEGMLLIEVDGCEEAVEKEMCLIKEKANANGAVSIKMARTQAESDDLWQARRSVFAVFSRLAPNCIVEDATVPVSQVPKMVNGVRTIAERNGLRIGMLAHAGDGNMHPLIATDRRDKAEWVRVETAIREIFELAVFLGGTLSGEHGIGVAKSEFMPLVMDDATQGLMGQIKKTMDPHGILNPGKFV